MGFEPTTFCLGSPLEAMETFMADRKATKGLTVSGEKWLRVSLRPFVTWLPVPLASTTRDHVVRFLAPYEDRPFRRHAFSTAPSVHE